MVLWAYKRMTVDIYQVTESDFETKLNEAGKEGWELVASFDRERGGNSKECYFIFKRPLE